MGTRRLVRSLSSAPIWPGPTNTGVPSGTTLTPVAGGISTTSNGQVFDSLHFSGGPLNVRHTGVIARSCLFDTPGLSSWCIDVGPSNEAASITITDCTFDSGTSDQGAIRNQSIGGSSWTALRCDISNGENGVRMGGNATLKDSWLHNFQSHQGALGHFDCVECYEGSNNVVDHCWLDLSTQNETACINVQTDFAAIGDFTVKYSYLTGGGPLFNIRSIGANGNISGRVYILNNSLGTPGAKYGDGSPQYSAIDTAVVRTTSGNVLYSNGSNADGLI